MPVINEGPKPAGSVGRAARRAPVKAEQGEASRPASGSQGERVTLSSDAPMLESVRRLLDDVSEVDAARVAELKAAVQEGRYSPDLDRIADGILEEALLGTGRRGG